MSEYKITYLKVNIWGVGEGIKKLLNMVNSKVNTTSYVRHSSSYKEENPMREACETGR
jgi:hypothetical protein